MNKYYYIKTRSFAEMNWWRNQSISPFQHYMEYEEITKWSRFKIGRDLNKQVDDIWEVHQMLKDSEEFRFYNSKKKEFYIRNTPTNTFRLRKRKGGYREITVFSEEYKNVHLMLHNIFQELFPVFPDTTSAYIKGKSQFETVERHSKAKVHLSLDLENFYPSIKTASLAKVLKKLAVVHANLSDQSVDRLAEMSTYGGSLAQGSSISPILSNIYSLPMEYELYDMVRNTNITFTKYADDISLSSPNYAALPNKRELHDFVKSIQAKLDVLYDGDLKINASKTKLQYDEFISILGINIRQEDGVTKLSIGTKKKREYMDHLFEFLCELCDGDTEDRLSDYQIVRGKIEYLNQFEPEYFARKQVNLRRTFQFEGDVWNFVLSKI